MEGEASCVKGRTSKTVVVDVVVVPYRAVARAMIWDFNALKCCMSFGLGGAIVVGFAVWKRGMCW